MKRFALSVVVFVSGGAVMIVEMTASRLLAPHLGTSIYVWTSLIGVILGSLSIGYWWGGRLSDREPKAVVLAALIFIAALWVAGVGIFGDAVLAFLSDVHADLRLAAAGTTALLFGVPGILLGTVSPYAVRLRLRSVDESGATVGSLYALSTAGSIVGTFLSGFVLVSHFSTSAIFLITAAALVFASLLSAGGGARTRSIVSIVVLVSAIPLVDGAWSRLRGADFLDVNTPYNRVWIFDGYDALEGRHTRMMRINDEASSKMFVPDDKLADQYTRFYRLAEHFHPGFRKTLMIGGAAYSYPKHYLAAYPEASMDVVEIDPGLTRLAREHFGLVDDPRLKIIHEDARTYLNRDGETYDVILGDAFKSFSIPFQLTTAETARRMEARLSDNGVVILNVISAVTGEKGKLLRGMVAAFKESFPKVYVFPVTDPNSGDEVQNVMLVALKSKERPRLTSEDPDLARSLAQVWPGAMEKDVPALRDAFAPVDLYLEAVLDDIHGRVSNPLRERLERRWKKKA